MWDKIIKSASKNVAKDKQEQREDSIAMLRNTRVEMKTNLRLKEEELDSALNRVRRAKASGDPLEIRRAYKCAKIQLGMYRYLAALNDQLDIMYDEMQIAKATSEFCGMVDTMNSVTRGFMKDGADMVKTTERFMKTLKPLSANIQQVNPDEMLEKLMSAAELTISDEALSTEEIDAVLAGAPLRGSLTTMKENAETDTDAGIEHIYAERLTNTPVSNNDSGNMTMEDRLAALRRAMDSSSDMK